MRTRTALTAAALAVAAALTLTACGDSGGGSPDKIEGADDGGGKNSPSPDRSAAPTGAAEGVDVSLPKDMKLVFDFDAPEDEEHAAAVRDAANFVRSIYKAVAEQSMDDPAHRFYASGQALEYAEHQIKVRVEDGDTATGTRSHYRAETSDVGNQVQVSFCTDQSAFFTKDAKTGEVDRTEPSAASYYFYRIGMEEIPGAEGQWRAAAIEVEGKAIECKE